MKLNNKGVSLMELLISIVLTGIILVFMFQVMVDLKDEINNNDFVYNNQVNRTELIYTIQNDLNEYTLLGVEDISGEDIEIVFHFKGTGDAKKSVLKSSYKTYYNALNEEEKRYYLTYESVLGEKNTWEMKSAAIDPCGSFVYYIDSISNNYYIKLNINIYNYIYHIRNNPNRNNVIDDIEITHASDKSNLDLTKNNYLTNSDKGKKQFGVCNNNRYLEHLLNVIE